MRGVSSNPGAGSTFWMTARIKRGFDATLLTGPNAERLREVIALQHAGVRVLVAEDDAIGQALALGLLEDAGLVVDVVGNGRDADQRASTGAYALILMDMKMPEMDGHEATLAIRQVPGMSNVPILVLTANAFAEDRDRCLAAGMSGYIGKPVRPNVLYATLLQWLPAIRRAAQQATDAAAGRVVCPIDRTLGQHLPSAP